MMKIEKCKCCVKWLMGRLYLLDGWQPNIRTIYIHFISKKLFVFRFGDLLKCHSRLKWKTALPANERDTSNQPNQFRTIQANNDA